MAARRSRSYRVGPGPGVRRLWAAGQPSLSDGHRVGVRSSAAIARDLDYETRSSAASTIDSVSIWKWR